MCRLTYKTRGLLSPEAMFSSLVRVFLVTLLLRFSKNGIKAISNLDLHIFFMGVNIVVA